MLTYFLLYGKRFSGYGNLYPKPADLYPQVKDIYPQLGDLYPQPKDTVCLPVKRKMHAGESAYRAALKRLPVKLTVPIPAEGKK